MKQIIPCTEEIYAVYRENDGSCFKERILAFGIDDYGDAVALVFDEELCLSSAEEPSNFVRYEMLGRE